MFFFSIEDRARPEGYDQFDPYKRNITKTCEALDLDAVVIVKTNYTRVVSFGNQVKNGTMFITAKMEMSVYDRKGEKLWTDSTAKDSSDTFAVFNGIYKTEKLDQAVISSTDNASKYLFTNLKNRMDKAK